MIDPADVLLLYRAGDPHGTFTRATTATYVDADGVLQTASSGVLRDAHYVNGLRTVLIEPARAQVAANPQAPASWTAVGTPVVTTGITDPWGGATAILIEDNDGAVVEGKGTTCSFTGDGTKTILAAVRAGTLASMVVKLYDATAVVNRGWITVIWNGGALAPTIVPVTGSTADPIPFYDAAGNLWWLLTLIAPSVVAANTNSLQAHSNTASDTGTFYLAGGNAWDAAYPTSWQATAGTRNADVLTLTRTVPSDEDFTVYAVVARPAHADASGSLGTYPGVWQIGTAADGLGLTFQDTSRQFRAWAIGQAQALNIDTGNMLFHVLQWDASERAIRTYSEASSVWASWSSAITPGPDWANSTLMVGNADNPGTAAQLGGGLFALVIVKGLYEPEDMGLLAGMPYVAFEDSTGETQLIAGVPTLNGWRPDVVKVGDGVERLSDATRYFFQFRRDYVAEFTVPVLRPAQLETALRLKEHLLAGGTVVVSTADTEANVYTCRLAPGTEPEVEFSDPAILDYSLRLVLKNTADAPLVARYR